MREQKCSLVGAMKTLFFGIGLLSTQIIPAASKALTLTNLTRGSRVTFFDPACRNKATIEVTGDSIGNLNYPSQPNACLTGSGVIYDACTGEEVDNISEAITKGTIKIEVNLNAEFKADDHRNRTILDTGKNYVMTIPKGLQIRINCENKITLSLNLKIEAQNRADLNYILITDIGKIININTGKALGQLKHDEFSVEPVQTAKESRSFKL